MALPDLIASLFLLICYEVGTSVHQRQNTCVARARELLTHLVSQDFAARTEPAWYLTLAWFPPLSR